MELNRFTSESRASPRSPASLSSEDVESLARLIAELRELTLSRGSYAAATDFLKRFGYEADAHVLVRPEAVAN